MQTAHRRPLWAATLIATTVTATVLAATPAGAVSGGTPAADGSYTFVAKLSNGDRSCTGALVDPQWVLTASSCFLDTSKATTVTVGGHVAHVAAFVPRADRNLLLAKVDAAITDIAPIGLPTTAPANGETVRVAGFGRTATEWVPDRFSTAAFTAGATTDTTLALSSAAGNDTCKGDAGGPAFRETAGRVELVGINSTSWQHGCLGETETRQGSTETRVDNLGGWLEQQMTALTATAAPQHAINLSWNSVLSLHSTSFKVYGSTSPDVPVGPSTLLGTVTTPKFNHGSLPVKQTWYYKVVPVNAAGQDGPVSAIASATTKVPTPNDFNGDGKEDIGAFYDYSNAREGLFVFPGSVDGVTGSNSLKWDSGNGNWEGFRSKFVSGDFNGDGKTDVAGFYDYGNGHTVMWVWTATADGFAAPVVKWDSGNGNWEGSRARYVAGDFNGDGITDIAGIYDYGNGRTAIFVWNGTSAGIGGQNTLKWDSGNGNWEGGRSQFFVGDFSGHGRADIAASYDYGNAREGLFVWTSTADGVPSKNVMKWDSGPGNWEGFRSKQFFTGDFTGDGRADIAASYDYGNGRTALWVWTSTADGIATSPAMKWDSGNGNWNGASGRFVAGDFNGDGKTDVAGFYDYGNSRTGLFLWTSTADGIPNSNTWKWDSGNGNWDMNRTTLL